MKTLHVELYGRLKDQMGFSGRSVQSTAGTPRQLWQEIVSCAGESLRPDSIRPVINDAFVDWDTVLSEGDRVAFLPPSSGG